MSKKFDVIIWGASGFSGSLIADYLCEFYPPGKNIIRWAIAGRSFQKLSELKGKLCLKSRSCEEIPILVGNIDDQESIDAIVKQTKVIIGAVGPFTLYGTPVIDSCVRLKTDYCDITGEVKWVRKIIDRYHEEAVRNNVLIIPMCGFDCVPSDLGAFMVVRYIQENLKKEVGDVKSFYSIKSMRISGGTAATALLVASTPSNTFLDPYFLNPRDQKPNTTKKSFFGIKYDFDIKSWVSPFVNGPLNTQVIQRSNSLSAIPYGKKFNYLEAINAGSLLRAFFNFLPLLLFGLLVFRPFRWLFSKIMPKPGDGPSDDRTTGAYTVTIIGKTIPPNESKVTGIITGVGGAYYSTGIMSAESALCLALSRDKLPNQGGVCTPASALGNVLLSRLRNAGMIFNVNEN